MRGFCFCICHYSFLKTKGEKLNLKHPTILYVICHITCHMFRTRVTPRGQTHIHTNTKTHKHKKHTHTQTNIWTYRPIPPDNVVSKIMAYAFVTISLEGIQGSRASLREAGPLAVRPGLLRGGWASCREIGPLAGKRGLSQRGRASHRKV